MLPDAVIHSLPGLNTDLIGRPIYRIASADSTNQAVLELPPADFSHGLVLRARVQTGGRGRMGRRWFSPPEGLWQSVALGPSENLWAYVNTTFAAALAVAETLEADFGIPGLAVKWPNDVLDRATRRKVCGILTETADVPGERGYRAALGIGLNVNQTGEQFPEELRDIATSMHLLAGRIFDLDAVQTALLNHLEPRIRDAIHGKTVPLVEELRQRSAIAIGARVRVEIAGTELAGKFLGLADDARLMLHIDGEAMPRLLNTGTVLEW